MWWHEDAEHDHLLVAMQAGGVPPQMYDREQTLWPHGQRMCCLRNAPVKHHKLGRALRGANNGIGINDASEKAQENRLAEKDAVADASEKVYASDPGHDNTIQERKHEHVVTDKGAAAAADYVSGAVSGVSCPCWCDLETGAELAHGDQASSGGSAWNRKAIEDKREVVPIAAILIGRLSEL